jgi:hypothetical protein
MKSSLATARTRVAATHEVDEDDDEEIGANAAATRAAGGAGGMPDFAAMMAGMGGAGGAGGMPGMPAGLASMMQNPAIMQMYVPIFPSVSSRIEILTFLISFVGLSR